jgi:O-acetyl-ADP-ribose deacetylase (regulator of RNase III)
VIHAVGPIWGEGDEDAKLAAAIRGSLSLADELKLGSISFPAISTGIYGFPKERAAGIIFEAIGRNFAGNPSRIKLVRIVLFDDATIHAFMPAWGQWS